MNNNNTSMALSLVLALNGALLSGCGGGGSGTDAPSSGNASSGVAVADTGRAASPNLADGVLKTGPSLPPAGGSSAGSPAGSTTLPDALVVLPAPVPQALTCLPSATVGASTYNVGPTQTLKNIADVDWNKLKPGDVVRVHWRATPYAEKILISAIGTVDKPVKLCGVPGGASPGDSFLPVITGDNATTRPDLKFGSLDADGVSVLEPLGLITIHHPTYELKPANIIIEGLHLKGANQFTQFTAANGKIKSHSGFAACIRLQKGDNVTIRGNEISDCGNGVFALSRDGENQTSRDLMLEANYVHGNGAVAGPSLNGTSPESVHAMYIQTLGMVAQFNYFGPNRNGSPGGIFKDRSIGSVVRYNWFSQGSRILDFVEPQDYDTSIFPAAWDAYVATYGTRNMPLRSQVVDALAKYQKTFVYGNYIRNDVVRSVSGAYAPVHFGGDQGQPGIGRQGKLYFFNNTVVTIADYSDSSRLALVDMGLGSDFTKAATVEAFNNIIHLQSRTPGSQRPEYFLGRHNFENINLGKNWITGDYQLKGPDLEQYQIDLGLNNTGVISGVGNLILGMLSPVNTSTLVSAPGNATLINAGQALPPELVGLPVGHQLQVNHARPLLSKAVARSSISDLGAASVAP